MHSASVISTIKPHHLNAVDRCGLLLQMSHVACLCVCVGLCIGHTDGLYTKTAGPMEMSFGGLINVGQTNHVLDGGQDFPTKRGTFEGNMSRPIVKYLGVANVLAQRMHSPPQGVKRRRCGHLPNYFGPLLVIGVRHFYCATPC